MIYVVTPVHDRRAIVRRFLECLRAQSFADFETVIVDDGSTDGTSAMIQTHFPEVTLLRGDGNLWWTGATNMGLEYVLSKASSTDYVLVINDDLEVDPHYLDSLISFAEKHPHSLIGSVVVDINEPDIIWDGGRVRNWTTAKQRILNRGKSLSEYAASAYVEVSLLTGRGMLAPVRVFQEVGIYNARHFRHRGDTELPIRAQRQGYKLLVSYGAKVKSHTGLTHASEQEQYRLRDFRNYFFDFRSSGALSFRYHVARAATSSRTQFVSYLLFDIARITWHFFRNCDYTWLGSRNHGHKVAPTG